MPDSLPQKQSSSAFRPPTAGDLSGKPSKPQFPASPPKPPSKPLVPPSGPSTSSSPWSQADSATPLSKPSTPVSKLPMTPPPTPPLKPPLSPSTPLEKKAPAEKAPVPVEKGGKGGSQKAKIVGAVLGLLLLLVALPVAIYLVSQRQYIWPKAAGEDYPAGCCYNSELGSYRSCPGGQECDIPNGACGPGGKSCNPEGAGHHKDCVGDQCVEVPGEGSDKCTAHEQCQDEPLPSPSPSPAGSCDAVLQTEAEDRDLCDHGSEAKVYVWATRSQGGGCGEASANYTWKKSTCCDGDDYEDCDLACSDHQETHEGSVTIPAGETESGRETISCTIPTDCDEECSSCQVDVVGGWGQMAWKCEEEISCDSECNDVTIYDDPELTTETNLGSVSLDQTVYFAVSGLVSPAECSDPFIKARFRVTIDDVPGSWQETTAKKGSNFYMSFVISSLGSYKVEAMLWDSVSEKWR